VIDLSTHQHEAQVYLLGGCGVVGEFVEEVLAVLQSRMHEGEGGLLGGALLYPQGRWLGLPGVVWGGFEAGFLGVRSSRFAHAFSHLKR
jgi:hypothetical protein